MTNQEPWGYIEIPTSEEALLHTVWVQGPKIGTCGQPMDLLKIIFSRARSIPDISIRFDGVRDGWSIGYTPYCEKEDKPVFKEVAFIHEDTIQVD